MKGALHRLFVKVAEDVLEGEAINFHRTVSPWVHRLNAPALDTVMLAFTRLRSAAPRAIDEIQGPPDGLVERIAIPGEVATRIAGRPAAPTSTRMTGDFLETA